MRTAVVHEMVGFVHLLLTKNEIARKTQVNKSTVNAYPTIHYINSVVTNRNHAASLGASIKSFPFFVCVMISATHWFRITKGPKRCKMHTKLQFKCRILHRNCNRKPKTETVTAIPNSTNIQRASLACHEMMQQL